MKFFIAATIALVAAATTVSAQSTADAMPSAYASPSCNAQNQFACGPDASSLTCYDPCLMGAAGRGGAWRLTCQNGQLVNNYFAPRTQTQPECQCYNNNNDYCSIDFQCYDNTQQYCDAEYGVTDLPTGTTGPTDVPTVAPTDAPTTTPAPSS